MFCSVITNYLNVGFGGCGALRHWDTKPYLYFPDIGFLLGLKATNRLSWTFDYEFNYIIPFKTRDDVREYEIFYSDFFITSIVRAYKKNYIQVGIGFSLSRSYLKFLEDDYLDWTPYDSVYYEKGEIVDMYDPARLTAKIAIYSDLPFFSDHLSFYCKVKGKSGPLSVVVGSYIPSAPHIPFHFSSGLSFSLYPKED